MSSAIINNLNFGNVYFEGQGYTAQWINGTIDSLCLKLEASIVSDSPFVYLYATNNLRTLTAFFAIIKTGKICVLLDPVLGKIERTEIYKKIPPSAEIFSHSDEIIFHKNTEIEIDFTMLDDVALMLLANGNNGYMKPVMLTQDNLYDNAKNIIDLNMVGPDSVSCAMLPFCHLFAFQTGLLAPSLNQGSIYISEMIGAGNFKKNIQAIINSKLTHFYSIPLVYYFLSKVDEQSFTSIKSFVSGGYKLPASVFNACLKKNIAIHEGYGLTETSPICTWHTSNDRINIESVGKPFGDCGIRIKKNAEKDPVGEVLVSGGHVMKGYYEQGGGGEYFEDGWFKTGDLGFIDDNNYLILRGMLKEMFNVTGKKVYKKEIERLLGFHENLEYATVTNNYNDVQGDTLIATVKLYQNSPEQVQNFKKWCNDSISSYKIPKQIQFI
jgi:long-subunit acyl-CoA synthetase (AMP-forming)